ncbi:MAG TPA: rhodanese-related sulfurtransferase [Candidatus Saccharimonadales bacterium]|nr:rhodanese-related sulfurtransferase [Candidatus Saccharimonadales bacterium]
MEKIILYYKFVPIADPETVMHWQKALAGSLGLTGRVLISKHGINGTLGGEIESLKKYIKAMNLHTSFKKIQYKWSDGGAGDFPKLSVKVRDEIVTFGVPKELKVSESGIVGGGKHLKPSEVHKLVEERGEEVVFMDGRNAYEAEIGRFKNARVPNTRTTKDFIKELEKPEYEELKDKPIVTYCTGGIRCEILSALMKNRGFKEVYQVEGGIAKYGEEYADDGLWEGKMYVFDKRMKVAFSDKSKDLGQCVHCQAKTSNYENCALKSCNNLVLICETCLRTDTTCSRACASGLALQAA